MRSFFALALFLPALFAAVLFGGDLSNRRAPGFSLPDTRQTQHDTQDYRGKVLVIDIMSTTCPHCRKFSGILEEAKTRYKDRIAVLSIVTQPDNLKSVQDYITANKITAPVLFDCGQVMAAYLKITPDRPTVNFPHVFLINKDGIIKEDYAYGPSTLEIFEGKGLFPALDRVLAAK
jgi:peroxiredoxin